MDILSSKPIDEVVSEITRIHKSLPERPGIEEIEAAKSLILNVQADDQSRFEAIAKQPRNPQVPDELFLILQEMQKNSVIFRSKEQRRDAVRLLDLENAHQLFDEMIQRASLCLNSPMGSSLVSGDSVSTSSLSNLGTFEGNSSTTTGSSSLFYEIEGLKGSSEMFTRDDSYVKKTKSTFSSDGVVGVPRSGVAFTPQIVDSSLKPVISSGTLMFSCFVDFNFPYLKCVLKCH